MIPGYEGSNVLDLTPRLRTRTPPHRFPESETSGTAHSSVDLVHGAVLICEYELLERNAFREFAERLKPYALLDLRPSPSMTFIEGSRARAFDLFTELGIVYVGLSALLGKERFSPHYWTSESLRLALADWLALRHRDDGAVACLFGNRAQLRRGYPTIINALELGGRSSSPPLVSQYRSGLVSM